MLGSTSAGVASVLALIFFASQPMTAVAKIDRQIRTVMVRSRRLNVRALDFFFIVMKPPFLLTTPSGALVINELPDDPES